MPLAFLSRLFPPSNQADGQAATLQDDALHAGALLAEEPAQGPPQRRSLARPDSIVSAALAQKVLHGWLQNRYQTRYPLVLNLRNQSPDEAALLIEAVQHALAIAVANDDEGRAAAFVAGIGGTLPADTRHTAPQLFDQIRTARLGTQAYAACAGAIGRRSVATRRFLDFLAARLEIADDVARSINRRFAS